MAIPQASWSDLGSDEKRRHLLAAAERVFASRGIDAPIPEIAAAAGTGIGTVYRHFSCKEELIAALVVERLAWTEARVRAALADPDPGAALERVLARLVADKARDEVLAEALARTSDRPEVAERRAATAEVLGELLLRARDAGAVRADATPDDLWLIFAATRAAERRMPGGARRTLTVMLDGLRRREP